MWEANMEQENIFANESRFSLKTIQFAAYAAHDDVRLDVKDGIEIHAIDDAGVGFEYSREISFEPESYFRVNVVFDVMLPFNEGVSPDGNWDKGKWTRVILDEYSHNLLRVAARISLLISEITLSTEIGSIVTPPQPMFSENMIALVKG